MFKAVSQCVRHYQVRLWPDTSKIISRSLPLTIPMPEPLNYVIV